jgi:hypothetical protein
MTEKTSPFFAEPPPQSKKQQSLDEKDRKLAWDFHFGPHTKETVCIFCNVNNMVKVDKGSWHASHIVGRTYLENPATMKNPLYLIPGCAACNLELGNSCALGLLWERGHIDAIKTLSLRVFEAYAQLNPQHMTFYENIIWKLIRGLYGSEKFPLGGGISVRYEEPIYKLLAIYQMQLLEKEVSKHLKEIKKKSLTLERLLHDSNRPMGSKSKNLWI